jgi:hypothetical protein
MSLEWPLVILSLMVRRTRDPLEALPPVVA